VFVHPFYGPVRMCSLWGCCETALLGTSGWVQRLCGLSFPFLSGSKLGVEAEHHMVALFEELLHGSQGRCAILPVYQQ
jgi:hypothetical protein